MYAFYLACAALLAVALGILLWPALSASEPQLAAGQASGTSPRRPSVRQQLVVFALVAVSGSVGYSLLGAPAAITHGPLPARQAIEGHPPIAATSGGAGMSLGDAAQRLAARLEREPDDLDGWALLIATYERLGWSGAAERARRRAAEIDPARFGSPGAQAPEAEALAQGRRLLDAQDYTGAVAAFREAAVAAPQSPTVKVELADALVAANGLEFTPEASTLLAEALALEPRHAKALWLAGTERYRAGDMHAAAGFWQRFLAVVPPQSREAELVAGNLREIGAEVLAAPQPESAMASPVAPVAGPVLTGTIDIAPALAARIRPADTLFVFARAAQGPAMPLAVQRLPAGEFPLQFRLDDSMAMAQGLTLASAQDVVVSARISHSGNALAQPGDLEGSAGAVTVAGAGPLHIVIEREVR